MSVIDLRDQLINHYSLEHPAGDLKRLLRRCTAILQDKANNFPLAQKPFKKAVALRNTLALALLQPLVYPCFLPDTREILVFYLADDVHRGGIALPCQDATENVAVPWVKESDLANRKIASETLAFPAVTSATKGIGFNARFERRLVGKLECRHASRMSASMMMMMMKSWYLYCEQANGGPRCAFKRIYVLRAGKSMWSNVAVDAAYGAVRV